MDAARYRSNSAIWGVETAVSSKKLPSEGRLPASRFGEFRALELEVPAVEGRYDSQSFGSGGTGGICCSASSSPRDSALSPFGADCSTEL